jgi:hypothetical protein
MVLGYLEIPEYRSFLLRVYYVSGQSEFQNGLLEMWTICQDV